MKPKTTKKEMLRQIDREIKEGERILRGLRHLKEQAKATKPEEWTE